MLSTSTKWCSTRKRTRCGAPARRPPPRTAQAARVSHRLKGVREVVIHTTWDSWRDAARRLIAEHIHPDEIVWREAPASEKKPEPGLFDAPPETTSEQRFLVPREFLDLARKAARHPDAGRWRILYAVLFRIAHGESEGMRASGDPDLDRLRQLAADVDAGRVPAPPPV